MVAVELFFILIDVPFVIPVVGSVSVPPTDPVIKTNKFLDAGIESVKGKVDASKVV